MSPPGEPRHAEGVLMEPSHPAVALFNKTFGAPPELAAAAPGRSEFIGNHCDYNGGRVMGLAIDREVAVAAGQRDDGRIELASESCGIVRLPDATRVEKQTGDQAWANYALGVWTLLRADGLELPGGFNLAVSSDLPPGAGMSSSAAFELAVAQALVALAKEDRDAIGLAQLCCRAENEFVGMPCGILDQGVSAFGERNQIVQIDCFTETFSHLPLPPSVHFHVFHTNKAHALVDGAYATRARECQQAFALLQEADPGLLCLAHAEPALVEALRPSLTHAGYRRARHVTEEHRRVLAVAERLADGDLAGVGELLTLSHRSSRDLFENSCEELDWLVDRLVGEPGVYGARLSGGGFGGAVMAMTSAAFSPAQAEAVARGYETAFGWSALIFHAQSGPGARVLPRG